MRSARPALAVGTVARGHRLGGAPVERGSSAWQGEAGLRVLCHTGDRAVPLIFVGKKVTLVL